jgi:hypothetical protein
VIQAVSLRIDENISLVVIGTVLISKFLLFTRYICWIVTWWCAARKALLPQYVAV